MQSKQTKRDAAQTRNRAWRALTPAQQLKYLDDRGFGAKRQRMRIEMRGTQSISAADVERLKEALLPPMVPRPKFKKGRKQ